MLKIGVLISGGGSNLQALIDNTLNSRIKGKIELIISNKNSYGLRRGKEAAIDSLYIDPKDFRNEEEYNQELIRRLKEREIDLVVLAGYLKILSKDFIREFKNRIINIHPSLLPKHGGPGYYGQLVHKAVLKSGDKYSGASLHFVDEGVDTGSVILQKKVRVDQEDTVESLQKKVLEIEHRLIVQGVRDISLGRIRLGKRRQDRKEKK